MDLRLLAGALLGSALTIALSSVAQAPRPASPCENTREIRDSIGSLTTAVYSLQTEISAQHQSLLGINSTLDGMRRDLLFKQLQQ